MAKAETKSAAKEQQNVSADNVVEKLMKGNLVTDIADKAAEEIRQDEEKRKISQVKEIVKCADYLRIKELLNVRKDRAKAKITLDILKKRTDLLARLLGKDENVPSFLTTRRLRQISSVTFRRRSMRISVSR